MMPNSISRAQATCQGFTLTEILIAILVVGLLTAALSSMMVSTLRMNQGNQQRLGLSTAVQRTMDGVRGAWLTPTNYNAACAEITVPDGVKVTFINLDARGNALSAGDGTALPTSACAGRATNGVGVPATAPPMRRIVVKGEDGLQTLSVSLDMRAGGS